MCSFYYILQNVLGGVGERGWELVITFLAIQEDSPGLQSFWTLGLQIEAGEMN